MNPYTGTFDPYAQAFPRALDFNAILRLVYVWLTIGLAVGFGTAFVLGQYTLSQLSAGLVPFTLNPVAYIVAIIAYLIVGFGFYPIVQRVSPTAGGLLFIVFAAIFGLMVSTIFLAYSIEKIAIAFVTTAVMFFVMSVIGFATKLDLTRFGSILLMALIGIIVALVVNIFLNSPALYYGISILGVLVFSGLTAYDTQWIKQNAQSVAASGTSQAIGRIALVGAFRLFLDFINLFLFLLRLLGGNRR
jgi:FtsH-binding integral membrane protein